jgi:hypothetical protein
MREILKITEQLGQGLQKKSQDIVNVVHLVKSTKIILGKNLFARLLSFEWIMKLLFQTWKKHTFCMVVVLVDNLIILQHIIILEWKYFEQHLTLN